jgi:hypothetical protein
MTKLISSNSTLFYRLFMPMFGSAVLCALVIACWADADGGLMSDILPPNVGNGIFTLLFIGWLLLVWRKMWTLRRVEMDDEHLYVSDYWHTAKYGIEDIETVKERKTLWLPMATIHLRGKGRFGRDIRFVKGRDAKETLSKFPKA